MRTIVLIILFSLTHSLTSLFVKIGLRTFGEINIDHFRHPLFLLLSLASNPFIAMGWVLILASLLLYYLIIARTKLSFAFLAPRSLAYILVILFSWAFLKEIITIRAIFGIITILIGIYLIS